MVTVTSKNSLLRDLARDWAKDHEAQVMKVSAALLVAGLGLMKLGQKIGRNL